MSIEIEGAALEKACRGMIETMFLCLPNAYKGTIYRIGNHPNLVAERITSGIIDRTKNTIAWGLPELSEYNPPGKTWTDYRGEPNRPLEAMAWCVENQKSWTSEAPINDKRNDRLLVEGVHGDCHHMEPVLVHKSDIHSNFCPSQEYPRNFMGDIIWQDSEYVVVAVIKIYFHPNTISKGSPETKVIKRLSRSLGTELLSYQLRQDSMKAMQQLAKDRLNACNILADSLRNAITKAGLIFSLVKLEIGHLRDQWEEALLDVRHEKNEKKEAIKTLNALLMKVDCRYAHFGSELIKVQNRFLELTLPPKKAENWVATQIEERWKVLLAKCPLSETNRQAVWQNIERLRKSLQFGQNPEIIASYDKMPENLKKEWVNILYDNYDNFNGPALDQLITILSERTLNIPTRERSRKTLIQLKALAETMNQLERNTNFLLRHVLNGENGMVRELLNSISGAKRHNSIYFEDACAS